MQKPIHLAGVKLTNHFTPDGLHPRTPLQGLLADTILEALHLGYGVPVGRLRMSDQTILANSGINSNRGNTFFDVRPFVLLDDDGDAYSGNGSKASGFAAVILPVIGAWNVNDNSDNRGIATSPERAGASHPRIETAGKPGENLRVSLATQPESTQLGAGREAHAKTVADDFMTLNEAFVEESNALLPAGGTDIAAGWGQPRKRN